MGMGLQLHPRGGRVVLVEAEWFLPSTQAAYWKRVAEGASVDAPWLRWTARTWTRVEAVDRVAACVAAYRGRWMLFMDGRGALCAPRLGLEAILNTAQQASCIEYEANAPGLDGTLTPALWRDMQTLQYWLWDHERFWPRDAIQYRPAGTPLRAQMQAYDLRAVRQPDHETAGQQARRLLQAGGEPDYAEAAMLSMLALAGALGRWAIGGQRADDEQIMHPYDDPFSVEQA